MNPVATLQFALILVNKLRFVVKEDPNKKSQMFDTWTTKFILVMYLNTITKNDYSKILGCKSSNNFLN